MIWNTTRLTVRQEALPLRSDTLRQPPGPDVTCCCPGLCAKNDHLQSKPHLSPPVTVRPSHRSAGLRRKLRCSACLEPKRYRPGAKMSNLLWPCAYRALVHCVRPGRRYCYSLTHEHQRQSAAMARDALMASALS